MMFLYFLDFFIIYRRTKNNNSIDFEKMKNR